MWTCTYHHRLGDREAAYVWTEIDTFPFSELLVSWSARRPAPKGSFVISVSVFTTQWSEWLPYALWGATTQKGGNAKDQNTHLSVYEDIASLTNESKATGFRIRVEAVDGASSKDFFALHACVSCPKELSFQDNFQISDSINLDVPLISQCRLGHPRCLDMCSATSTTAVIRYLLKTNRLDPVAFALKAHDEAFDIFGNWVLNTAQASEILGKEWNCWVARLSGFNDLHRQLSIGMPVVVSIRGPLSGSSQSYAQGHLIVIKGYDSGRVFCMDPAFPSDKDTDVSYALSDFLEAWSRRQNIAYMFRPGSNWWTN